MTLLEYYLQHEIIKVCLCTNARQNTKENNLITKSVLSGGLRIKPYQCINIYQFGYQLRYVYGSWGSLSLARTFLGILLKTISRSVCVFW